MVFEFIKRYQIFFLLLLLCIPAIFALTHRGFFISDDGEWMIIRLSAFFETLKSLQFPVRFIARLNNGYGYPLGDFMYPGFLYLGSLFHLFGIGFTNSIKLIFGISLIFSTVFTYLWLEKLFSRWSAFFAALVSLYMPYHLFDVYQRGSIGEVLALAVVPFIFWQIERKNMVLSSVGIGFLVLAHNTLAFLFIVPLYIYLLFRLKGRLGKRIIFAAIPSVLGAGLSMFFWFPALYDLQYTIFRSVTIADWHNYFASVSLIGIPTVVVIFLTIIALTKKQKNDLKNLVYVFLGISLISIFLASSISTPIWQIIPASIIQFPFRFLSLLIPSIAFLYTYSTNVLFDEKKEIIIGSIVLFCFFLVSFSYLTPQAYIDKGDAYYLSNFSTTSTKNEYMPIWVKKELPPMSSEKVVLVNGKGSIRIQHLSAKKVVFDTTLSSSGLIQVNTVYFPGWEAIVDGKVVAISAQNDYGLIHIPILPGKHTVSVSFTETPIRLVTDLVSFGTVVFLVIMFFTKLRYNALQPWRKESHEA